MHQFLIPVVANPVKEKRVALRQYCLGTVRKAAVKKERSPSPNFRPSRAIRSNTWQQTDAASWFSTSSLYRLMKVCASSITRTVGSVAFV